MAGAAKGKLLLMWASLAFTASVTNARQIAWSLAKENSPFSENLGKFQCGTEPLSIFSKPHLDLSKLNLPLWPEQVLTKPARGECSKAFAPINSALFMEWTAMAGTTSRIESACVHISLWHHPRDNQVANAAILSCCQKLPSVPTSIP